MIAEVRLLASRARLSSRFLAPLAGAVLLACSPPFERADARHRTLVIGIDGADWGVLERLWSEGRLPSFRRLAQEGTGGPLGTAWSKSPVIWTTIATGVHPDVHGITDFVVPSAKGDVPVSASTRRVPALWNMASAKGLAVAVFGWWASWPAEDVAGVVLSDRALDESGAPSRLERRASPAALDAMLPDLVAAAGADPRLTLPADGAFLRDRLMAHAAAERLRSERDDLVLVYFRTLDVISHHHWKDFEPERFGLERRAGPDPVTMIYEQIDNALGVLLDAAGADTNVLVLSDHGFKAFEREQVRVALDFDRVLEALGFLSLRADRSFDPQRTRLRTVSSPLWHHIKSLEVVGDRSEPALEQLASELAVALTEVAWPDGTPAFELRLPRPSERRHGADLVVRVLTESAARTLLHRGQALDLALDLSRLSGTHTQSTSGIFLARGPDLDPDAVLEGIRIHDIAPTVLYGLGLPVGEDFVGAARTDLYSGTFRERRPLATVASWGTRDEAGAPTELDSALDEEIKDDLRSLGYIE